MSSYQEGMDAYERGDYDTASHLNSAEYCFRSLDPIEHLLA